jgi:hypothetical protein
VTSDSARDVQTAGFAAPGRYRGRRRSWWWNIVGLTRLAVLLVGGMMALAIGHTSTGIAGLALGGGSIALYLWGWERQRRHAHGADRPGEPVPYVIGRGPRPGGRAR